MKIDEYPSSDDLRIFSSQSFRDVAFAIWMPKRNFRGCVINVSFSLVGDQRLRDTHVGMLERAYRRMGRRYVLAMVVGTVPFSLIATALAIVAISLTLGATRAQFLAVLPRTLGTSVVAIFLTFAIVFRRLQPVYAWLGGQRDVETAEAAWS